MAEVLGRWLPSPTLVLSLALGKRWCAWPKLACAGALGRRRRAPVRLVRLGVHCPSYSVTLCARYVFAGVCDCGGRVHNVCANPLVRRICAMQKQQMGASAGQTRARPL